ncbi:MAG: hypothetical protein ABJB04_08705 [Betaproteobacteria bacterium]
MADSPAFAAPPSQLSILRACGDADTAAQCERVLEAGQIRQFPTIAVREGGALRLKTRSGAPIELRDKGVPGSDEGAGFRFYSLWDYWPIQQTAIVSVSAQSGDHYLIVDLNRGSQTKVGAEPVLSPSGTRFVVVDFCETECGNAIELWHFDRDRIVRERTFRPREKWYDADVSWKDPTSLEIEYSVAAPSGEKGSDAAPVLVRARPMLLRITDRAWTDEAVR